MEYSFQNSTLASAGPSSQSSSPTTASEAGHAGKRLRTGCHSCRIRKKRCDEAKPMCDNCTRLGIQCLGYSAKRPEWLKEKKDIERTAAELKEQISSGRGKRPRRSSSGPQRLESGTGAAPLGVPTDVVDPELLPRPLETMAPSITTYADSTMPLDLVPVQSSIKAESSAGASMFELFAPSNETSDFPASTNLPLERDLDEIWKVLFGNDNPFSIPTSLPPAPPESIGENGSTSNRYLHHYLNVVLPMQFHQKSSRISDVVAPLAMSHPDVLDAVSSLAALHMGAQRTRQLCAPTDTDVIFAQAAHRKTIDRLRLIPVEEFPTEQVVILAIFATSFQLYSGGTAKMWRETIAVCQRCLSIMLARSENASEPNLRQYPELMPHLMWVDVVSSICKNTGSRLLDSYRKLLLHRPISTDSPSDEVLLEKTMGCDSTTTLALAEIVALSEWRCKAFEAGTLAVKDLLERARPIEQLLEEREWRESHLQSLDLKDRLYSDIFFYTAKILLASTVDGPYPSLPDIAIPVGKMQETLRRLDEITQNVDLARGLVLPITVAGCHAATAAEEAFFRERFTRLSPEAAAFGNTHSALELMEEVWRRRAIGRKSDRIVWIEVMLDMGWEAGILLI